MHLTLHLSATKSVVEQTYVFTCLQLWIWDTAQQLVIMINSWRSSNNMSV